MQKETEPDNQGGAEKHGFWAILLQLLIRDTIGMWLTVLIGTAVRAVICLYFGAPLIFSLVGGILVLAIYIAWVRL